MKISAAIAVIFLCTASRAQNINLDNPWWSPILSVQLPIIDSLGNSYVPDHIFSAFDKTLSLYTWTSRFFYATDSMRNSSKAIFTGIGTSRLRNETDSRVTDAGAHLKTFFPITSEASTEMQISGSRYQTNSGSTNPFVGIDRLSRLTDGYGLAGIRYQYDENVYAFAGGGYAVRDNIFGSSSGFIMRSTLQGSSITVDDDNIFDGTLSMDERWYSLQQERYRNDNVSVSLLSTIGDEGTNSAKVNSGMLRRDFFFSGDSLQPLLKQERNETYVNIYDDLNFDIIHNKFHTSLSIALSPRIITRRAPGVGVDRIGGSSLSTIIAPSETYQSDFRFGLSLALLPSTGGFTNTISSLCDISYRERTENNKILLSELPTISVPILKKLSDLLSATSYRSQETSFSLTTAVPVSRGVVGGEFSARLYRYDTPSLENVDDRDELYLHGLLKYQYSFSKHFNANIGIRLSRYHLVYIEAQRSGQNNQVSSISLFSRTDYNSRVFDHSLTAEITANYTEYDFMTTNDLLTGKRDYAIRSLSLRDSAFLRYSILSLSSGLELRTDIRLYEQSSFNADKYTRRPQIELNEYALEAMLHLAFGSLRHPVLLRFGAKGLVLVRSSAETVDSRSVLRRSEEMRRIGPAMTVTLDNALQNGFRLFGSLWYSTVKNDFVQENRSASSEQIEARIAAEVVF